MSQRGKYLRVSVILAGTTRFFNTCRVVFNSVKRLLSLMAHGYISVLRIDGPSLEGIMMAVVLALIHFEHFDCRANVILFNRIDAG